MSVLRASSSRTLHCFTPRLSRSLIPSFPAISSCPHPAHVSSWAFCHQGTEFWGVFQGSSCRDRRDRPPLRVWGGESWMGMVPISTGILSSTSAAHLRLCSKWRPWNICINNKQIHTKYIPTTWVGISRKSRNSHHASRIKRTNKSYYTKEPPPQLKITHHCCASAWKVRIQFF